MLYVGKMKKGKKMNENYVCNLICSWLGLVVVVLDYDAHTFDGTFVVDGLGEEALVEEPVVAAVRIGLVDAPHFETRRVHLSTLPVVLVAEHRLGQQALIVAFTMRI